MNGLLFHKASVDGLGYDQMLQAIESEFKLQNLDQTLP
jgi:hypothetical protein